jgi:hypothetical protein
MIIITATSLVSETLCTFESRIRFFRNCRDCKPVLLSVDDPEQNTPRTRMEVNWRACSIAATLLSTLSSLCLLVWIQEWISGNCDIQI